jgi:hypothetical protein
MRGRRVTAALLLAVFSLAADDSGADLNDTKQRLIEELLDLSGGTQAAEQVPQMFLAQIEYVYPSLVDEVVASEADLGPEQRASLRTHLADFERFSQSFRARFPARIDLAQVLQTVYAPLYDRYFEEAELREMVAFYASPTGQKMLAVMPGLLQEGLGATIPLVEPQLMALVGETLAARRGEWEP